MPVIFNFVVYNYNFIEQQAPVLYFRPGINIKNSAKPYSLEGISRLWHYLYAYWSGSSHPGHRETG